MPNDRTVVTELATSLGTLRYSGPAAAIADRPPELRIGPDVWAHLESLHNGRRFEHDFTVAFANGRFFLAADEGLRGRPPLLIEWTGGRRPPGDEVAPIDLRIDHVYLISCKYLSSNIANPSPARLFDGLLATTGAWERGDWYRTVAPDEYWELYRACRDATELWHLPGRPEEMTSGQRDELRRALRGRQYPSSAQSAYRRLTHAVSLASTRRWIDNIERAGAHELMVWRLLRIGSAPYFVLGSHRRGPVRLRVASPWDWREQFRLLELTVAAGSAGQPQVNWLATYEHRRAGQKRRVQGHVEVRWSHGRFAQPPEAKIYLDTPARDLPGYFTLDAERSSEQLF